MNSVQSPLFEPVLWEGDRCRILDEISLPEQIQYITVRDVSQAIDAVREMKTRAFGQVLTIVYSGAPPGAKLSTKGNIPASRVG